jgi:glutathione S-transferase
MIDPTPIARGGPKGTDARREGGSNQETSMKLYYATGACSLSPHIALREAGMKFDLVKTDIRAKTVDGGGDFRKVSPNGYVPALELDDGTILTEGPAIVQYIADQAPAKSLAPANGSLDRYRMQSWLNFVTSELHKSFSVLFNQQMPDDAKKIYRDRLATRFDVLDKHLEGKDYLMGARFSVADGYCFTVLNWSKRVGIDLARWTHISRYMERVSSRPAVRDAMKAEGLTG